MMHEASSRCVSTKVVSRSMMTTELVGEFGRGWPTDCHHPHNYTQGHHPPLPRENSKLKPWTNQSIDRRGRGGFSIDSHYSNGIDGNFRDWTTRIFVVVYESKVNLLPESRRWGPEKKIALNKRRGDGAGGIFKKTTKSKAEIKREGRDQLVSQRAQSLFRTFQQ